MVGDGLSPLARGTPHQNPPENAHPRFIPAGAGNTLPLSVNLERFSVYPRWRGEHYVMGKEVHDSRGLSPLARGTLDRLPESEKEPRFIPAGAGNTPLPPSSHLPAAVYPRWRGEHLARTPGDIDNGGLSPLARGTPGKRHTEGLRDRFIPAGAGNTVQSRLPQCLKPVYPRWRGEHARVSSDLASITGLSPLARGTH